MVRGRAVAGVVAVLVLIAGAPRAAQADAPGPFVTQDLRVAMSDGVQLLVRLGGHGPLVDGHLPARPVIAEFSPYGPACCAELAGPAYNYLEVHIRGTGDSDGAFDALGPRSQQDLAETLAWACAQPWSDHHIGLYGFSASAIVVYNSLHLALPCLGTAVLGAGTHELYRDLLYPGGIPNGLPALGVFGLIGAPLLQLLPNRLQRNPASIGPVLQGMAQAAVDYNLHPTLDAWWQQRGMRGDVNHVPILGITGFFDVESRGPFQAFNELKTSGMHLYVVGAHDGVPAGSGGATAATQAWFDRNLRGVAGDAGPTVRLWLANGDRVRMLNGDYVTTSATDWPVPNTTWTSLYPGQNGTLSLSPAAAASNATYVPLPSLPSASDPATTSLLGVFNPYPQLTNMNWPEALGLTYTTPVLAHDVWSAGPASLEVALTGTSVESDLWAVVTDVWPDGTSHPMATGRLRTSYPDIDLARSRVVNGTVVQPYSVFSAKRYILPGTEHRYFVEFWPIGNRFQAGHRLRLDIVGASGYYEPTTPLPNLVRLGGAGGGTVLRLPVLPGTALAF